MDHKSVMIAMSGGVDSSVAAWLMARQGYTCLGSTMRMCDASLPNMENAADPAVDARAVAEKMGIPFYVFQATEEFRRMVIDPFVSVYESGGTPNPCICCNHTMKFGYLLEQALDMGCSHIVTGHYAKLRQDTSTGRYLLYKAEDPAKDQSYFLAGLNQHQLSHILFPLGELTKEQVRRIATEQGFITAKKRDSQDICFIPDGDFAAFIRSYTQKDYPAGDFLDRNGNVVGQHTGAFAYTLGQRKGLGLAMGEPVYVCGKDMANNTVTVGPNESLFATTLVAENWNWLPFPALCQPIRVMAKARYRHTVQSATVYPLEDGKAKVVFDEPQRAITPGQAVVLYEGDMVVGAGTITTVE